MSYPAELEKIPELRMETDQSHTTERILNLTLEIIYLMTGENYIAFKLSDGLVTSNMLKTHISDIKSPPHSLHKDNKKIQEFTREIIELLAGEVPLRCQDGTMYFSMEQWENIGHRDLYKDIMMENQPPLSSPDGSSNRNTPERCHRPLYYQDSTQNHQVISEDDNDERLIHVKVEITEREEKYSQTDVHKEVPTDGSSLENIPERCLHPLYSENWTHDDREFPQHDQEFPQNDQDDDMIVVKVEDLNDEEAYGRYDGQKEEEIPAYISTDGRYSRVKSRKIFKSCETQDRFMKGSSELIRGIPSSSHLTHGDYLYKTLPYIYHSQEGECFSCQRIPTGKDSHSCLAEEEDLSQKSCQGHVLEVEVKPYACSVCGKSFRVKSVLIRHEKVHTGEKPYDCSQCGKSFAQKSDLAEHERIHTGERPYPCTECGKCFAKKTNLARHLRMHLGVKPYACTACGKAFTQKAALDEHARIHTGEKPYACSHCTKCFAQKSAFAEHQRVHTGERPYACAECRKCFTQGSALAKHQRVHQKQKPRPCPQCGKSFPSEFLLALHERVHQANYQ